jgi:hypothetical protein
MHFEPEHQGGMQAISVGADRFWKISGATRNEE